MAEEQGVQVRYGIHAVAGRMPGHMNVLLAEANVPYDELYDMEPGSTPSSGDGRGGGVGANDVVNPAAKRIRGSHLRDAHPGGREGEGRDRLQRSLAAGFAGSTTSSTTATRR